MKCEHCGHEGSKAEFRYLRMAESSGPDTYRLCPECRKPVFCEELAKDEQSVGMKPWGLSPLRGKVFTKNNKPKPNKEPLK